MKIGVNLKIDVTKIDKSRLFNGEKGTYLNLSTFIDIDNLNLSIKSNFKSTA